MSFRNWKYLFTEAKSIELELPVSFKSYFFAKNIMSLIVRKPVFGGNREADRSASLFSHMQKAGFLITRLL